MAAALRHKGDCWGILNYLSRDSAGDEGGGGTGGHATRRPLLPNRFPLLRQRSAPESSLLARRLFEAPPASLSPSSFAPSFDPGDLKIE